MLAGSGYLFWGPAQHQADLVAGTIGASGFGITIALVLASIVGGSLIKRSIGLKVFPPQDTIISGQETLFVIRTSRLSIPPLYSLRVRLHFLEPGIECITHEIRSSLNRPVILNEELKFPHRGIWTLKNIEFKFGDLLGSPA